MCHNLYRCTFFQEQKDRKVQADDREPEDSQGGLPVGRQPERTRSTGSIGKAGSFLDKSSDLIVAKSPFSLLPLLHQSSKLTLLAPANMRIGPQNLALKLFS